MSMVDESNLLVKEFRRVRDYVQEGIGENVDLKLFRNEASNSQMYNLPVVDEVAALIVGDFDSSDRGRDIILRTEAGFLQRVSENHKSFLPLQYPLIFTSGKYGYSDDIKYNKKVNPKPNGKHKCVSMRQWIAFRIQERQHECYPLPH